MFNVFESIIFSGLAELGRALQSTMSVRNLADVALKVRIEGLQTGSYPRTLAAFPEAVRPDPFAAKPLSYVRRPDGSVVISVPDFAALGSGFSDAGLGSQPYTWELPAPAKAVAKK